MMAVTKKKIDSEYSKCAFNHPPLRLGKNEMFGGACARPVYEGCDIYVGLDAGHRPTVPYPWEPKSNVIEFTFKITDGRAPQAQQVPQFHKLIDWICERIKAGDNVHVGCIGGHGRTGMVLAAVVSKLGVSNTPIAYVRQNYCADAVETEEQIKFLAKHYNAEADADPTRSAYQPSTSWQDWQSKPKTDIPLRSVKRSAKSYTTSTGKPCRTGSNIFGKVIDGPVNLKVNLRKRS
jgi:hypothetical protein